MGSGRTTPPPRIKYPAWMSVATIFTMAGLIVTVVGLAVDFPSATNAGGLLLVSGLVVNILARLVWSQ
mgnify:CR=1 FL=1